MSISKFSIMNIVVRHKAEIVKRGKWKVQSMPNITDKTNEKKI